MHFHRHCEFAPQFLNSTGTEEVSASILPWQRPSVLSLLANYSTTQKHAGSISETCVLLHHMEKQQKLHMLIFPKKITSFFAVCRIDIEHKAMSGGNSVKGQPEERAIQLAQYLVETGATVRQTAAKFGVSKSTVHKDITERLYHLNLPLYTQAHEVLMKNKEERHIRGGMATRKKYRGE